MTTTKLHPAYANSPSAERRKGTAEKSGKQPGDPRRAAKAMCTIVEDSDPPLRIVLGNPGADMQKKKIETYTKSLEKWDKLSRSCDFPEGQ